jgi:glycosyltransferase involved in cell wall biosynthesis
MGVDLSLYESPRRTRSGKIKSFRKAFGLTKPFILYCGYKNYEKGAISLLQAALKVQTQNPNLMYVFIGPSTSAFDSEIKKVRHQGVSILNLTPDNLRGYYDWRKIAAFQECEMYVMPSRSDAYGISYLEAWASKKPVIGADTLVMREVICHEKDGLLVEFDNSSELSKAILSLYENPQKEKEMGLRGYEKTKKHNTWKKVFKKTMSVYSQLVDW